ncbi:flavin reductase [Roseomonas nepalensis]|uniref:Flavin reductase n=1 Tax=Muricoccus nepalensis TaxID=1854500 RepID=A0A502FRZ0_9PROT|nr:flavin reductase [Roseomonas nepalensis]TPG51916.1 flavin reductase [Roseomonas nepalensis]
MEPSRQEFRDAMARLGAAVTIVTSDGEAGRVGITASAVCSVTDTPPTIIVCMNRTSSLNPVAKANGVLCVNVLSAEAQELANVFAGFTGASQTERFEGEGWTTLATGAPVLEEAVVALDCAVEEVVEKGTHSVIFAQVQAIRLGAPRPALIWFSRNYHPVGMPD